MPADIFRELFDGDVSPERILFECGEHNGVELTLQASPDAVHPFLALNQNLPAARPWRLLSLNHRMDVLRLCSRHLIGPLSCEENIQ